MLEEFQPLVVSTNYSSVDMELTCLLPPNPSTSTTFTTDQLTAPCSSSSIHVRKRPLEPEEEDRDFEAKDQYIYILQHVQMGK